MTGPTLNTAPPPREASPGLPLAPNTPAGDTGAARAGFPLPPAAGRPAGARNPSGAAGVLPSRARHHERGGGMKGILAWLIGIPIPIIIILYLTDVF